MCLLDDSSKVALVLGFDMSFASASAADSEVRKRA